MPMAVDSRQGLFANPGQFLAEINSQAKGALDRRIYKVMRLSWENHYRRTLPDLLSVLEFRSNNAVWRPVLAALDWIRSKAGDSCRFVPMQDIPIDGVIPSRLHSSVVDDDGRVNRISYELCVLTRLRDRIRFKLSATGIEKPFLPIPCQSASSRNSCAASVASPSLQSNGS